MTILFPWKIVLVVQAAQVVVAVTAIQIAMSAFFMIAPWLKDRIGTANRMQRLGKTHHI